VFFNNGGVDHEITGSVGGDKDVIACVMITPWKTSITLARMIK
jgi:hypothetical protein